ncbi:MFS transporter [Sulfitobacter alexandrii]|uniref:MFS transporter n=1 Tax=Sulfitobacter alexandrii TaxID=1917485 RepID=A0A1J0WK19_9RHOB|nr:class I SAM-dependent methyltransferase [Sulfitobacter alexandrii]APE44681.1 MFS transporter [Sulfitobacter alexandrii]
MIDARLDLALQGGLELPEEGLIAVFRPPQDARLPGIDRDRCHVVQDFKPLFDAWQERGYKAVRMVRDRYAAAVVCLPRAKSEARALIAAACGTCDGVVVIDGQKTQGIDSILREMRGRVTINGPISKAHGKLFWIDASATDFFADWAEVPSQTPGGFWTAPGVFSADAVDLASALLVDALPEKLGAEVADLGAGWGFLAAHVLTRESVQTVHLVEAGHSALECARHNVTDDRAKFHWEDATKWAPPHRMDSIVMNPPFHQGRAAEPQIGQAFVASAARLLQPNGNLWMVANRHLPYEAELKKSFGHVAELGGDARFKLFHASKPARAGR